VSELSGWTGGGSALGELLLELPIALDGFTHEASDGDPASLLGGGGLGFALGGLDGFEDVASGFGDGLGVGGESFELFLGEVALGELLQDELAAWAQQGAAVETEGAGPLESPERGKVFNLGSRARPPP
jgi:hypothetical protein